MPNASSEKPQKSLSMSSKQQKLRRMEKPGLGYGQMNAKPFSIRHYALISRQQNIVQSWPFSQKHLKLCLNNGVNNNNILPPIQTPTNLDALHGRLAIDLPLHSRKNSNSGRISRTKVKKTKKISKPGEDLKVVIPLLCEKLGQLSLSSKHDGLVGSKQHLMTKLDNMTFQSFKAQTSYNESDSNKGKRRKGKTKMKSLVDILAVAKRCVLKGNERIVVSGCKNGDERCKRKVKGASRSIFLDSNEGFSSRSMKKHQRCDDDDDDDDYVLEISRCKKRSRATMEGIDHKNEGFKLKSWSRKRSSCTTAETEKAGGYERKDSKHMVVSVMEMQDHQPMQANY